jgi:DNA-directed RNA polymerase specialized sigma24 family protein
MRGPADFRAKEVFPVGRALPVVIDCVPNVVITMPVSGFQTTSWTLVQAAAENPSADSRQALATLCQAYWPPVYAFIRRNGYDLDQAQDLSQGFFALLLEKNYLGDADRRRGKFRSFLLTAVKHFLANEWDRSHALKRGGGQLPLSIDLVAAEKWCAPTLVEGTTPENLFERRWALSLLEQVLSKLRAEFAAAGKADQMESLSVFLNEDFEDARSQEVAEKLGMSAGALRTAVHRMRRKYRSLLRDEIAQTVSKPEEIDEEIRFLMSTLGA